VRKAICKVADGGLWIERADAETLLDHVFSPAPDAHAAVQRVRTLTPREAEIITLVCAGLRNKQIAAKLCISETTVWHHMSSIFSKLRVSDRVALVRFAFQYDVCQHIERGSHGAQGADRRGFRTALHSSEEPIPAITSLAS
jgi:DNA-binding NarL/FixJ family response regulator